MGTALLKIKIMPSSPDVELETIENESKSIVVDNEGKGAKLEREAVAFGLNAVIITFARDEEKETDTLLEKIQNIPNVSSAEIIDFRRALG
jgi:elongation factor 1-beta